MILLAIVRYIFHRRDRELIMAGSVGVFVSLAISVRSNVSFTLRPDPSIALRFVNPDPNPFSLLPRTGLLIHQPKSFSNLKPLSVSWLKRMPSSVYLMSDNLASPEPDNNTVLH